MAYCPNCRADLEELTFIKNINREDLICPQCKTALELEVACGADLNYMLWFVAKDQQHEELDHESQK